jgi:hypothetical protein
MVSPPDPNAIPLAVPAAESNLWLTFKANLQLALRNLAQNKGAAESGLRSVSTSCLRDEADCRAL